MAYCALILMLASLPLSAATWPQINLVKVYSGVNQPTAIVAAGDGSGRLFFLEQAGLIRVARNGAMLPQPFLDITSRVICCDERGLLGLAFPPNYQAKRHFYVDYVNKDGNTVIARYSLTSDDVADPASETILLTIAQPFANHKGGQLAFSPRDGFLYIGMGDGGSGGDPQGNGQNRNALLGKLLRIDVESGTVPYGSPPSNPFASQSGARPEVWAYGLRNPWRFSFDRATADLYIADVGQDRFEEIDFQPATSTGGENYGWNIMEGNHCYPANPCNAAGLTAPVVEYDHSVGCSVTGGFVYRGARYPQWQGTYFYADYCSGRIWGLQNTSPGWQSQQLLQSGLSITTFGQDETGELYLADQAKGDIYLIEAAPSVGTISNAASFEGGISPGSLASILGSGLTVVSGVAAASSFPLPMVLRGTSVTVNGTPAPLIAVLNVNGQDQINFQVPYSVAGAGTATVAVSNNGLTGPPIQANVLAFQPGIFAPDGIHAASLHGADYSLVNAASPADRGEVVALWGTGFGPVSNPPELGKAAPLSPLSTTTTSPLVTIGERSAEVLFSGLAPDLAGVYQLNVRVPADAPSGDADVIVTIGGRASPAIKLPVR